MYHYYVRFTCFAKKRRREKVINGSIEFSASEEISQISHIEHIKNGILKELKKIYNFYNYKVLIDFYTLLRKDLD